MERSWWYILIVVAACALGYWLGGGQSAPDAPRSTTAATEQELYSASYWENIISLEDAAAAYDSIGQYEVREGPVFAHGIAHAFGSALYATAGVAAITTCDDRFLYGCVHEVVSQALVDQGISALTTLTEHCRALQRGTVAGTACEHGIGHGLIGHLGYTSEDLQTALALCADVVDQGFRPEVQGCMGGVFMEYNMRALLQGEGTGGMRPFAQYRNEPCDDFTGTSRLGCIYWQVQWWQQAILGGTHDPAAQATLGQYCDQLVTTTEEEQVCYGSIGTFIAPAVIFSYLPSAALCRDAATTDEQALYCAVRAYRTITKYTDASLTDTEAYCAAALDDTDGCVATIASLHGEGEQALTPFLYSPLVHK